MKPSNKLSDRAVKAAKPEEKQYKLSDGGGLYLLVKPTGSRLWQMAYRLGGKQKTASFGPYPLVSLNLARQKRDQMKLQLLDGVAPSKPEYDGDGTFQSVAEHFLDAHAEKVTLKQVQTIRTRLQRHLYPDLGHRRLREIRPSELLDTLRKLERKGLTDMVRRMRQACGQIFRHGVGLDQCDRDITPDLKGLLLPPPPVRHNPQLSADDLPAFLERLHEHNCDPVTRDGILLTLHTMVRTKEIRLAKKEGEFDLTDSIPRWRIPKERMKKPRPHQVPLSPQAIAIYERLERRQGQWLLQGPRGRPISENTMLYCLYDMGYKGRLTIHGLRGTASTILNDSGRFDRDWVETQLAHDDEDSTRAAYNAAIYIRQRYDMLKWWSDLIDEAMAEVGL